MTVPKPPPIPLEPVPGVMRCVINQQLAGVPVINILHAWNQSAAPWAQDDADRYIKIMRDAWVANVLAKQSHEVILGKVVGTDLTNATGVVATSTDPDTPGTVFSNALPANAAMTVSWPIPRHYRGGHPRTYLAGFDLTLLSNANSWTAAAVTSLTTALTAFRATVNAAVIGVQPARLVCVHRKKAHATLKPPVVDILGPPGIDNGVDSQRRRLGRR